VCEALVVGSGWRPEQVRRRLVCVTRQMDVFARSAMARHFGVHNDYVTDVVVVGDLHAQRRLIVVNTEQVRAEARPRVSECGGVMGIGVTFLGPRQTFATGPSLSLDT